MKSKQHQEQPWFKPSKQKSLLVVNSDNGGVLEMGETEENNRPYHDLSPHPYYQNYKNDPIKEPYVLHLVAAHTGSIRAHINNKTWDLNTYSDYLLVPAIENQRCYFESEEEYDRSFTVQINRSHITAFYLSFKEDIKSIFDIDQLVKQLRGHPFPVKWPALMNYLRDIYLCLVEYAKDSDNSVLKITLSYLSEKVRREILFRFGTSSLEKAPPFLQMSNVTLTEREQIDRIARHIEEFRNEPLNLDQLCQLAVMSKSKLYTLFKKYKSTTPIQYYRMLKMEYACQLLRNVNLSIAEVGMRCGFNREDSFIRSFKTSYGISPTKYRNMLK